MTLETSHGFVVRASGSDAMHVGRMHVLLNSHQITDLLDPSEQQDAATKVYVDGPCCVIFTGQMPGAFHHDALKIGLYYLCRALEH